MSRNHSPLIAALNDLLAACYDGHHGYETAAQNVRDRKLKKIFRKLALERKTFEAELRSEIVRLGGQPHKGGSFGGAAHRGWMQATSAAGADALDILKECAFGEKASVKHYQDVLSKRLPPEVKTVITRQYERVADARDLVVDLRR